MYFKNLLWNTFTPLILNFIVYPFIILNYFENTGMLSGVVYLT